MKFSCGLTNSAKDKKLREFVNEYTEYLTNWHKVFLWLPTTIGSNGDKRVCAWLQFVERKYNHVFVNWFAGPLDDPWRRYGVQYREITKES